MKIAVNARFLIQGKLEGIGWYSYQILKNIVESHPEHQYIFFFDRSYDPEFIFNDSVKPVVLRPPARHPFLWYWWFEKALPKALKVCNADVFFSPDAYLSLSVDIPQYLVVHDLAYIHYPEQVPFLVRMYYQYFVPRQIEKARHIFAVSEATRQDIVTRFNCAPEKISIAYNGVRSLFKPISEEIQEDVRARYSQSKKYFLFVGAIHPRKNVAKLIQAFDLFCLKTKADFQLLIVGRKAWMTDETEAVWQNSPNKSRIQFYSYMDTEQLALVTASAFAAINPSLLEGFGVPVLEALNCDVPVLVSNCFSLPEVAGPGAYIFDPNDLEDIAIAMIQSIDDPKRTQRIEAGAIHRMQFNWQHTAEHIYNTLIQEHKEKHIKN
ncbi:MAG: glycosyltransferase family 4 protein [Saprospiraceae bacterium]|nr:glycosyltransferase family 4 protein [Saprospiraceae bacterium]